MVLIATGIAIIIAVFVFFILKKLPRKKDKEKKTPGSEYIFDEVHHAEPSSTTQGLTSGKAEKDQFDLHIESNGTEEKEDKMDKEKSDRVRLPESESEGDKDRQEMVKSVSKSITNTEESKSETHSQESKSVSHTVESKSVSEGGSERRRESEGDGKSESESKGEDRKRSDSSGSEGSGSEKDADSGDTGSESGEDSSPKKGSSSSEYSSGGSDVD